MNLRVDGNTAIREFDSIGELLQFLNTTPDNGKYYEKASQRTSRDDVEFAGTPSYEEAVKLLTQGWSEAADKMTRKLQTAPQPAILKRTKSEYSVAGHTASIPRYLQGIPTNMISSAPDRRKQPVITINHGITYNAMWSAEGIMDEGIKALQVVKALEASNRNVKMYISCVSQFGRYKRGFKVCIKQPGERLNISKMAFPLAHPSMLRRLFFKHMEVEPDMPTHFVAYGQPSNETLIEMYPKEMYIPERVNVEKIFSSIS